MIYDTKIILLGYVVRFDYNNNILILSDPSDCLASKFMFQVARAKNTDVICIFFNLIKLI